MIRPGDTIGKSYRLIDRIGAGDLGEVWRAQHEKMGRTVAIKLLRPKWPVTPAAVSAFLRDARASGRLQEPNLIELLDQGEHDGMPYVVMPLLEAEKLDAFIARCGALPPGMALRIVGELAQGLSAAHEQRVFHLRIEAANVLLHRDQRRKVVPKLIDFGIVRLVGDPNRLEQLLSPIAYLAPEQCAGEVADGRADVWALGMLLLHATLGRTPCTARTPADLLGELDSDVRGAIDAVDAVDPRIAALLRITLLRDRTKRPQANVFARRLRDLATRMPDDFQRLETMLQIPESMHPSALQSVAPLQPPKPPKLPQFTAPKPPVVIARMVSTRGTTGRRRSRRLNALLPPPHANDEVPVYVMELPEPASGAGSRPLDEVSIDVRDGDLMRTVPPGS